MTTGRTPNVTSHTHSRVYWLNWLVVVERGANPRRHGLLRKGCFLLAFIPNLVHSGKKLSWRLSFFIVDAAVAMCTSSADLSAHVVRPRGGLPPDHVYGIGLRAWSAEQRPLVHVRGRRLQETHQRSGRPHPEHDDVRPRAGRGAELLQVGRGKSRVVQKFFFVVVVTPGRV